VAGLERLQGFRIEGLDIAQLVDGLIDLDAEGRVEEFRGRWSFGSRLRGSPSNPFNLLYEILSLLGPFRPGLSS
jgi:hypothetical protein